MIAPKEKRWALWFGLAVALVTAVPYLLGYASQGSDWRFTGFLFGVEDGNSYIAKMLLGTSGYWLFRTPYTPYPQGGLLAFFPYLLLGKLAAPPGLHEQLVALFQVFRGVGTVLYVLASYAFVALFVERVDLRRLGTALAALGGGLGWLILFGLEGLWQNTLPGMDMPTEFYSPETFGFLMVFGLPHLAVGRALLLWGLRAYLLPRQENEIRHRVMAGLMWLALGLMQPLTVVVGWAVLAAHLGASGVRRLVEGRSLTLESLRRARFNLQGSMPGADDAGGDLWRLSLDRALWMGLISAPVAAYTLAAFRLDPFLVGWEGQNLIVSPPFGHYLLAFGLLLPLAALGVRPLLRAYPWTGLLPVAWVILFPFLAYAPYNLQRRLPEGVFTAFIVLALVGVASGPLPDRARAWAQRWLWLAFPATLVFYLAAILTVTAPQKPLFRPAAEERAFLYLQQNAARDAVVLAAYETSNALPAWAPVRTITGHGPESLNLEDLQERTACFYALHCADGMRARLLAEFEIDYVLRGPAERELGGWDPREMGGLTLVYDQDGYEIYKVGS
jgi:hypothetical protein